jgi:hypothetical protein
VNRAVAFNRRLTLADVAGDVIFDQHRSTARSALNLRPRYASHRRSRRIAVSNGMEPTSRPPLSLKSKPALIFEEITAVVPR